MKKEMKGSLINFKNSKGFLLIASYLLLSSMMIFALGLFQWATTYLKSSERNTKKVMAFNIAEAGFDDAYYRVKNSSITYPWNSGYTSMTSGGFQGGYSTTVTDMGSNIKRIAVTSYSPSQTSTTESVESRTVTGYVQTSSSGSFAYSVFAETSIHTSGNATIDSYNSNSGAYGGSNQSSNGTLATDGPLQMSGNATVKGNTYSTTADLSGNVVITGTAYASTGNVNATGNSSVNGTTGPTPGLSLTPATTGTASSGALAITGNTTVTLAAGTYNYTSLSISGNGLLSATGAVKIYVSGTISIAGNGISTSSSKPPNMIIYSTGSSAVNISGNANLYAGIYSPYSAVSNSGNGAIYGAVVSNTYTQSGNGAIHYDQALSNSASSANTLTTLSWNESNLTNG